MTEDLKKTAKAYGTVSEAGAEEIAKEAEKTTKKLLNGEEDEFIKEAVVEIIEEKKGVKLKKFDRDNKEFVIENWSPKTKLGIAVKKEEIKNIDEILNQNKKILEPQIVDSLIPVKTDLVLIGQAKGKFGGGKRRAWRQTQRKKKEGNVLTFSAMAIVGDENGHIGTGIGKATETLPARDKATRKAKLNLMKVTRGCGSFDCSCSEPHSIPFIVEGKAGSVRVTLMPASQGTGLIAAKELQKVLALAGIKDVYSKTFGKKKTSFNLVKACLDALDKTNKVVKTDDMHNKD
jgi:small subunit ribosomal protein S5